MEVSIGFIKQGETYLLQLRPDLPTIGAAGLIGAFGGRIEPGESPVEAVCRELREETSLKPSTEDFSYLGTVNVTAYKQQQPLQVSAKVFRIGIAPTENVTATDGEVVSMTRAQADENIDRLTPATRAAFEQFL
jgi:8-oxo-dGTP pyrophosphatase MutT (NUDIX family)